MLSFFTHYIFSCENKHTEVQHHCLVESFEIRSLKKINFNLELLQIPCNSSSKVFRIFESFT